MADSPKGEIIESDGQNGVSIIFEGGDSCTEEIVSNIHGQLRKAVFLILYWK